MFDKTPANATPEEIKSVREMFIEKETITCNQAMAMGSSLQVSEEPPPKVFTDREATTISPELTATATSHEGEPDGAQDVIDRSVTTAPNMQLPLIAELSTASAPVVTARAGGKPLSALSERHLPALQQLLQGPVPVTQITSVVGALSVEQALTDLREHRLDIPTVEIPAPGQDNQTIQVTVCYLTKRDNRKLLQYVKKQAAKK